MKFVAFNAKCPLEIGDKVRIKDSNQEYTITDICCVHYVKSCQVEFRFELDNSGQYVGMKFPESGDTSEKSSGVQM